jgi:hypothetical protein
VNSQVLHQHQLNGDSCDASGGSTSGVSETGYKEVLLTAIPLSLASLANVLLAWSSQVCTASMTLAVMIYSSNDTSVPKFEDFHVRWKMLGESSSINHVKCLLCNCLAVQGVPRMQCTEDRKWHSRISYTFGGFLLLALPAASNHSISTSLWCSILL